MAPADDDAGSIRHDDVGPAIGMMDHADGFRHGLLWAWRAASYHARITFLSNLGRLLPCARVGDVEMLHMAWASLPQAGAQLLLPSCAVVTQEHREYFGPLSSDLAPGCLVVQPSNQGTLAGIVYSVMRVEHLAGDVPIAILPSDHDVIDDRAFMTYVESAVDLVRALPDRVVLLGIEAETPETEYGWVEPSRLPLPGDGPPVFPVRRFWEKPSPTLARVLLDRRCLWNSFRSEEHTSELQSRENLVCRLLLEKKKLFVFC